MRDHNAIADAALERLAKRAPRATEPEPDPDRPPELAVGAQGSVVVLIIKPPPMRGQDRYHLSAEQADALADAMQKKAASARAARAKQMQAIKSQTAKA